MSAPMETLMLTSSPSADIHDGHDPLTGPPEQCHSGFTSWLPGGDASASGQSPDPSACPAPAPDRQAAPRARVPLTPREIAAHLLGAAAHGIGVFPMLELRQFAGGIARR